MNSNRGFIASPLFNQEQIDIIEDIEDALELNGYTYYSARRDSEPDMPAKEDRGRHTAWLPVFNNNVGGMKDCGFCICVLSYALPYHSTLAVVRGDEVKPIQMPDTGTVWEASGFWWQGKPVIGYIPNGNSAEHLNLMLTHSIDGLLVGPAMLNAFLYRRSGGYGLKNVPHRLLGCGVSTVEIASQFNWVKCVLSGAQQGGIEDASKD